LRQSLWWWRPCAARRSAEALTRREAAFAAFVADEIAANGPLRIAKEIGLLTGRRSA
jgi:hypothetical protein